MVPPFVKMPVRLITLLAVIVITHLSTQSQAQFFTHGNLTVLKVGDGVAPLSSASTQIGIAEYTTAGVATSGIVTLPSTGTSKITIGGTEASEGMMTLSAERDRLVFAGYDADGGTAAIAATTAAANNRELYTIDHNGFFARVATSATAYSANNVRSGTASGTNYFSTGSGSTGITLLNTSLQLTTAPTDVNVIQVFNGQTYFTSGATGFSGLSKLGVGIPSTTGQVSTLISPVTSSPYGFSISPDSSVLYIADDVSGITRYNKVGTSYVTAYVVNATPARGLTVDYTTSQPVLYATTTETSANKIIKITDGGAGSLPTVLVTAPANTAFRGITFSPACYAAIALSGAATICSGNSTDVTITGNPNGVVSYNINGGTTLTATIGADGSAVVNTGALTSNSNVNLLSISTPACSAALLTGSVSVSVNPLPAAITGPSAVCNGLTGTLAESSTGGTWSSSNTSVATIDGVGVVTGVDLGTTTISYVLPTTCMITKTVTVNAAPSAIAGTTVLCSGNATILTDPTPGGTWSSSNTGIANIVTSTGYLLALGSTVATATITYTIGTGCYSTTVVTVNPSPVAITGTFAVCVGLTTTALDASAGGTWTSGAPTKATVDVAGIITGVAAGTSIITYTMPGGCFATRVATVNGLPAAITGATLVCVGSVATLHDATAGGTWSSPGSSAILTIGSASGIVTGIAVGNAVITYKSAQGCITTTSATVNPAVSAITGPATVCTGSTSVPFTDVTPGGTWSSNNTYVAVIGSTTGAVFGWNAGLAHISYSTSTGCYATVIVTVLAAPAAVVGTTNVCVGSTIIMTDVTPAGAWSVSGPEANISSTGVVTGISAGTVLVSYTLATGCPKTKEVTVNPLPTAITGTLNVCVGSTTDLTSASAGGIWTSSLTTVATVGTSSGVATGVLAGYAHITYTLPTGCKTSTLLTVNTAPAAITGTTNVCIGSAPSVLSDITPAGIWTTSDPAVLLVSAGSGGLITVGAGTATITYTLYDGCYATHDVTVNISPLPVTGTMTVCQGSSVTFADPTAGGTWSTGGSIVSVGSSTGSVTGIAPGVGYITYALPSGCAATGSVSVNAIPAPIVGPSALCSGTPGTFVDASFGGSWISSNTSVATIHPITGVLTEVAPGTTTITYSYPNGCHVTSAFSYNPLPAAIAGAAAVCAGIPLTLTDASAGGTWISGNTLIASVDTTSGVVTGLINGTSKITYTLPTGCTATTIVTVKVTPSAIAGPSVLCNGSNIILVNSAFGGIWSSSNTAVATIGTSSLASIGNLVSVTAGTVVVTYAVGDCMATLTVTVSPMPTAITNNTTPVCQESAFVLADSVAGGDWNTSNASIASVSLTGVVTGVAPGTATITYSINAVCLVTAIVTVNPVAPFAHIVIGPAGPLCINTLSQNFGANAPEPIGVTYTWGIYNAVIDGVGSDKQFSLVSFHHAGPAVITLSSGLTGLGCARTDSFVTTVSGTAAAIPTIIYFDHSLTFLDNTADFYQWGYDDLHTFDSSVLPDGRNQDYYLPTPDFGSVRYWAISEENGCSQKTYYYDPASAPNAISSNSVEVSLFPNPATNEVTIEVAGAGKNTDDRLSITDMSGKTIYNTTLPNGKAVVAISRFAAGVYSATISRNGAVIATKVFSKK